MKNDKNYVEANETVGTANPIVDNKVQPALRTVVSTKVVQVREMTRGEHSISKGFPNVIEGTPEDDGMYIKYDTGYESWCPIDVYNKDYNYNGCLTLGQATIFLKRGFMITRMKWKNEGKFLFMQIPSMVPKDIIPKMTSLPLSVKREMERRKAVLEGVYNTEYQGLKYSNQIAQLNPDNTVFAYAPSCEDILAEDYYVIGL